MLQDHAKHSQQPDSLRPPNSRDRNSLQDIAKIRLESVSNLYFTENTDFWHPLSTRKRDIRGFTTKNMGPQNHSIFKIQNSCLEAVDTLFQVDLSTPCSSHPYVMTRSCVPKKVTIVSSTIGNSNTVQ